MENCGISLLFYFNILTKKIDEGLNKFLNMFINTHSAILILCYTKYLVFDYFNNKTI